MRPFWSPLSALILLDPPSFATPTLLRLLLRAGRPAEVLYAGDRMWPAARHGAIVRIEPLDSSEAHIRRGTVVVACPGGIPDLLRVDATGPAGVGVCADADPQAACWLPREALLGRAALACSPTHRLAAAARRLYLDLREAASGRPDRREDPAQTVRSKYDRQAPFYAAQQGPEMDGALLDWLRRGLPPRGRLLVAGSGSGRECFALLGAGWRVSGVDFSEAMVEAARREAARRHLDIDFVQADLRVHSEPAGSLAAIYFSYDVYSFIPSRSDRVSMLRRMKAWLQPDGALCLSARRFERAYDPVILTLQRLARVADRSARWGHSHTRWIGPDGSLHRSFVQVFSGRALAREVVEGGFVPGPWLGNHCLLTPCKR